MAYTYEHPRPSVTTDAVIFFMDEETLKVLLIKRKKDPFAGKYAIPGGFLDMDENPETGARRELEEETGLKVEHLYQVAAFGEVNRDPRGRIISIAHYAFWKNAEPSLLRAADDASEIGTFDVFNLPSLAFDHHQIIEAALRTFQNDIVLKYPHITDDFQLGDYELDFLTSKLAKWEHQEQ